MHKRIRPRVQAARCCSHGPDQHHHCRERRVRLSLYNASPHPPGHLSNILDRLPIVAIAIVLFFLHRRTTKRQAAEDARDADKDLDFGVDASYGTRGKKGKKGGPEMIGGFKGHGTGMSIDLGNPYILPPEVNGSSESLHSLSRSVADKHDPYRMVKTPSIRSGAYAYNDFDSRSAESQRDLLGHPQPMSKTPSPLGQEAQGSGIQRKAVPNPFTSPESEKHSGFDFGDDSIAQHDYVRGRSVDTVSANRLSNPDKSLPATPADGAISPPPRGDSKSPYMPNNNAGPVDPYGFQEVVVPPSPEAHAALPVGNIGEAAAINGSNFAHPPPPEPEDDKRLTLGLGLDFSGNRLSVLRPLPPDDPEENPEQRANRIRSFYKEYFSEGDAHGYNAGADYYEDYGDEYLQDGTVFDPDSGQFIVAQAPYAAPITRRAMTPPPRGPPPRFRGGPRRPGHMSSGSSPGLGGPRARAYSNASTSRMGNGPRGRAAKRPLPPPAALQNLPTPSLLKENAFDMTIDFAPPTSYADRAAGRPDSPYLGERPYAPKFSPATPLASSFQELAVVPSPHSLRKSSTFTALDFAPPPRFRDPESGSDAGSIRSGRSNFSTTSARQKQNIRAGAYRLSRLPKGVVGTRNDIMDDLKPKWDLSH